MIHAQPTTLAELLTYWDDPETHPYKGSLLSDADYYAYTRDTTNPPGLNCMCAQGQILTVLDGTDLDDLHLYTQPDADRRVAELLNISVTHAIVLRNINDSVDGAPAVVLTDPAKILGSNADKILDLWHAADAGLLEYATDAFDDADYADVIRPMSDAVDQLVLTDAQLQAYHAYDGSELITFATRELLAGEPGLACQFLDIDSIPTRPANYGPQL